MNVTFTWLHVDGQIQNRNAHAHQAQAEHFPFPEPIHRLDAPFSGNDFSRRMEVLAIGGHIALSAKFFMITSLSYFSSTIRGPVANTTETLVSRVQLIPELSPRPSARQCTHNWRCLGPGIRRP